MKICKICGSQVKDDNEFCLVCGSAISDETKTDVLPEPVNDQKKMKYTYKSSNYPTRKKQKLFIVIAIIAIISIIAVSLFYFTDIFKTTVKDEAKEKNELIKDSSADSIATDTDEILTNGHTIEFYPRSKEDIPKLESCAKTINERLKAINVIGEAKTEDGKIVLNIERDFATSPQAKETFIEFLSASGTFHFGNASLPITKPCNDFIENVNIVSENKETYLRYNSEKLQTNLGFIDIVGDIEKLDGDDLYFVQVSLDTKGATEYLSITDTTQSTVYYSYFDAEVMISTPGVGSANFKELGPVIDVSGGKGTDLEVICYRVSNDKTVAELIKYILESKPMECYLEYACVDEPVWETENLGENQKEDIDGKSVVFNFKVDYVPDDVTPEDYSKSYEIIKNRLETLNIPYSFGYMGYTGNDIAIKFNPNDISSELIRIITASPSIDIYNQFSNTCVSIDSVKLSKNTNNTYCFEVKFSGSKDEITDNLKRISYNEEYLPEHMQTVYLVANDVTVSSAQISDVSDDGILKFTNLICNNKDTIEDEDFAFAELITSFNDIEASRLPISLTGYSYSYRENGKKVDIDYCDIPWKANKHIPLEEVSNVIKKYNARVNVSYKSRNTLEIIMNIPFDDNFVSTYINTLKAIYTECNFDAGAYHSVEFYAERPENFYALDESRIYFSKSSGKMKFGSVFFNGPTFKVYAPEIKATTESDEFFISRNAD